MRRKTHPKTRKHTLCEPAQSKDFPHVRRDITRSTLDGRTLCASLRSKRTSTCQKRHQKSHVIRKFTGKSRGKRPRPRSAQNADEHFVRACAVETHVKRNLQVECRRPE